MHGALIFSIHFLIFLPFSFPLCVVTCQQRALLFAQCHFLIVCIVFCFFFVFLYFYSRNCHFQCLNLGCLPCAFPCPAGNHKGLAKSQEQPRKKGKISSRGRESATYRGTSRFYLNSFGLFVDPESSTCPSPSQSDFLLCSPLNINSGINAAFPPLHKEQRRREEEKMRRRAKGKLKITRNCQ